MESADDAQLHSHTPVESFDGLLLIYGKRLFRLWNFSISQTGMFCIILPICNDVRLS